LVDSIYNSIPNSIYLFESNKLARNEIKILVLIFSIISACESIKLCYGDICVDGDISELYNSLVKNLKNSFTSNNPKAQEDYDITFDIPSIIIWWIM